MQLPSLPLSLSRPLLRSLCVLNFFLRCCHRLSSNNTIRAATAARLCVCVWVCRKHMFGAHCCGRKAAECERASASEPGVAYALTHGADMWVLLHTHTHINYSCVCVCVCLCKHQCRQRLAGRRQPQLFFFAHKSCAHTQLHSPKTRVCVCVFVFVFAKQAKAAATCAAISNSVMFVNLSMCACMCVRIANFSKRKIK